jgi:hypothetical protein
MHYPRVCIRESFAGKIQSRLQQVGFRTSGDSKHAIIQDLRDALGDGILVMPDALTFEELTEFGYLKKDRGNAKARGLGALKGHDDLVMSLAIAWYTTRFAGPPVQAKNTPIPLGEQLIREWEQSQKPRRRQVFLGGPFGP